MKLQLINYVSFQAGWLACVLSAAYGRPLIGLMIVVLLTALHLGLALRRRIEARMLLICAAAGAVFDSLLLATGWVSYPNGEWLPGLAPYWIVAIWILFGTTLNLSMAWLKGRFYLAVLMGAAGGPLSYIGGQQLGAIQLENEPAALIALGVAWAVLMPALSLLAERMNGFEAAPYEAAVAGELSNERVVGHA